MEFIKIAATDNYMWELHPTYFVIYDKEKKDAVVTIKREELTQLVEWLNSEVRDYAEEIIVVPTHLKKEKECDYDPGNRVAMGAMVDKLVGKSLGSPSLPPASNSTGQAILEEATVDLGAQVRAAGMAVPN